MGQGRGLCYLSITATETRANGRKYHRTDFSFLLLAAPQAALRRLGEHRCAADGAGPRWARPLPQLGLDRAGVAQELSRDRTRSTRPWGFRLGNRRQLLDGRLRARPDAVDARARRSA